VALDNARLYEDRERVVRALQETLLPPALPDIAGLDVAARYRVAEGGIDIGGDFYDVFPLPGDAWAVVVGDVSGKGPSAAAVTGMVRHALRAVALSEPSPARVLAATNAALGAQVADSRFCTAVLLHVEAHGRGARVVAANAGHPRPFRYTAGGSASLVEAQGTLLGVVDDPVLTDVAIDLAPGDALILVTDGVTEARRGNDQFGEQGVLDCLSAVGPGATAAQLAAAVVDAAAAHAGGDTDDDTAVVVVKADA
jgi:serine phosphatase RsbU (regulator of sigma subunit)